MKFVWLLTVGDFYRRVEITALLTCILKLESEDAFVQGFCQQQQQQHKKENGVSFVLNLQYVLRT